MKQLFFVLNFGLIIAMLVGCNSKTDVQHKTLKVHDTLTVLPEGEFTYNLPCKVVNINQEKEGKSMLFIWLNGGVKDRLFSKIKRKIKFNQRKVPAQSKESASTIEGRVL